MKELQPINQYVLLDVSPEKSEQQTASGIYIPDTAKSEKNVGKVISMSSIDNPEIGVGDEVVFRPHSGDRFEMDAKEFLFIPYADILGKLVETESI